MGEDSKGIAASEGSDGIGSCQTQHVGISPQKDRGCSKGTVGEGEGGEEEGGIELGLGEKMIPPTYKPKKKPTQLAIVRLRQVFET